jgi:hypothetical protein
VSARSPMKHALAVAVAVVYVVVALPDGSYAPEAIGAGTLIVWWAVIVGLAVGAWPRTGVPRAAIGAGACVGARAAPPALSPAGPRHDGRAFLEVVRVAGYTGVFALVVLSSSEGSARSWLLGIALGAVAIAALALGSRLEPSLPGNDREIGSFIAGARGRLSYPIGYWNGLGACIAIGAVLLAWLGARAETRLGRSLAVAALPPLLLAVYLTSSRGGMTAAVIGLIVLLALGPARVKVAAGVAVAIAAGATLVALTGLRSSLVNDPTSPAARVAGDEILLATVLTAVAAGFLRHLLDPWLERASFPRRLLRPALIALAVVAVAGVVAADPINRFEEFKQPSQAELEGQGVAGQLTRQAGSGRYQFWTAAVDAFGHEPVTGIGAGGYEAWWNQNGSIARVLRNAHSLFLETLAELGILGLALVVAFLTIAAVQGWRRLPAAPRDGSVQAALAVLAAGTFSAAIDWTWELPAAFGPIVVVAALLTGAATVRAGGAGTARRSFGWGVATLLAGWAAVWVAGVLFLGQLKIGDSRSAADRGDLTAAAQDARDASTLQPWAAEPYLQSALVQEQAGNIANARTEIDKAIDRAPEDWRLWLVAARIERAAGDNEATRAAFERAQSLNPRISLAFAQ